MKQIKHMAYAVERGWLHESRSCVNGPVNLLAALATAATLFLIATIGKLMLDNMY
jgi:hypothetical protein